MECGLGSAPAGYPAESLGRRLEDSPDCRPDDDLPEKRAHNSQNNPAGCPAVRQAGCLTYGRERSR